MKISEILSSPVKESFSPLDVRNPIKQKTGLSKKKKQATATIENLVLSLPKTK